MTKARFMVMVRVRVRVESDKFSTRIVTKAD